VVNSQLPYNGLKPVCGYATQSVTQGHYNSRLTVTFRATEHHRPLDGSKLCCVTD